ncbi:non-functional NADPH-dependent codeinone reductase 2-like [Rhododendron vialii]|uniref:non-functional NADPH-dependent codeinone reductase 2-like n=1 Tax=Rhododendron vialii TaxID=182163 RepID=UPI002660154C|nr:non-functional NADPH-dependent codeinone reductase 2-like [Rhododendron vialii]
MDPNAGVPFSKIPETPLSSGGRKMPVLGFGTASDPPVAAETTKQAVLHAIEVGYRHFDTAALYYTEEPLGEAIAEAINLGLIKSREEIFITSKLWCSDSHQEFVLPALRKTLKKLKLEYIDLYLIHWPVSSKPGIYKYPIKKEDFLPMDYKSVWSAMEECQRLGLTKAIGVSNFSCKKLADVLATAIISPAVNQVEVNPVWQQKKLIEFCKGNGILVVAYAALGAVGTFYGTNRVMESDTLKEIAKARGKTVAQVCLRWAYEQGIGVVVKSFNKERMKQNLEIFNWALSKEESQKIGEIPQSRACLGKDYTSVYGPFKTIEEVWDGEL